MSTPTEPEDIQATAVWRYRFPDEENGGKIVGFVRTPPDWGEPKARHATGRAVGLPRGVSLKKMSGIGRSFAVCTHQF